MSHEDQGTGFDPNAHGHELQGREAPRYALETTLNISALDGPDIDLTVTLKACPKYKLGAYYTGRLIVGGVTFKVKAICVCSTAGGRAWMAWDEKLDDRLGILQVGDNNRRAVTLDITPPGGTTPEAGNYIVCIHPRSDSDSDD
ncbi:MAG: hypothetical protein WC869_00640 [Phycisphaerae bacterium]